MVMTMKLVKSILTKNPCYKAGKKITVKGLMLHSVGCPQPRASAFINRTGQIMTMPVSMLLLTEMMVRCTRHFRGIIGDGMAVVLATIPISVWRCVSRLV